MIPVSKQHKCVHLFSYIVKIFKVFLNIFSFFILQLRCQLDHIATEEDLVNSRLVVYVNSPVRMKSVHTITFPTFKKYLSLIRVLARQEATDAFLRSEREKDLNIIQERERGIIQSFEDQIKV